MSEPHTDSVKEFWWEGKDFHVITSDDRHFVYTNAIVTGYKQTIEGKGIETVPMTFVGRAIDETSM